MSDARHGFVGFSDPGEPYLPGVWGRCEVAHPMARPPDLPPSAEHPNGWWYVRDDECTWEAATWSGRSWTLAEVEETERGVFMDLAWHLAEKHGIWEPQIDRHALQQVLASDHLIDHREE